MPGGEELLRTMYAAWNQGGPRQASRFWAEDVVVHDFPELPDAVISNGRDHAVQIWEERMRAFG